MEVVRKRASKGRLRMENSRKAATDDGQGRTWARVSERNAELLKMIPFESVRCALDHLMKSQIQQCRRVFD